MVACHHSARANSVENLTEVSTTVRDARVDLLTHMGIKFALD